MRLCLPPPPALQHTLAPNIQLPRHPAGITPRANPVAAAALCPPRPLMIWAFALAAATLVKNLLKPKGPQLPQRRLQDSGECPFPFIFFHDPLAGLQKHPLKLVACVCLWVLLQRESILQGVSQRSVLRK